MNKSCPKMLLASLALALLCACSPAATPLGSTPTPALPAEATEPDAPAGSRAPAFTLLDTFSGHEGRVLDLVFSPRGDYLASSGQDRTIRLWDLERREEAHRIPMTSVDMADIDISADGNLLASGEALWDLNTLQEIHSLERGSPLPAHVAFAPDGSTLALGLFEQGISLWDVAGGEPVFTFEPQEENRTKRMAFSPDGATLALGVYDGTVRLLDVASGNMIAQLHYGGETDIHDLAFSADGRYLATGGRIPAVVLWDAASGEVARTLRLTDNLISLAFSPDGTLLASAGGYAHEVRLWEIESGDLVQALPHDDQLMTVAFSPDGSLLAAGGFDGRIYLWGIPPG